MNTDRINELIKKYINKSTSKAEEDELLEWYRAKAYQDAKFPLDKQEVYGAMLAKINDAMKVKSKFNYRTWAVAASVIIVAGLAAVVFKVGVKKEAPKQAKVQSKIQPGSNRAILTLADGSKISLVDATNGRIATEGDINITKSVSSQLIYSAIPLKGTKKGNTSNAGKIAYNTIETPAGGQYQVILPDHS